MIIDSVVIAVYFLVMLFVGWKSRKQSADSYWVAERKYSTDRITLSLVATIFGASSTMGIIGLGYSRGLTGAWWALVGGLFLIPFSLILASRVRRLNVYTLPDILKLAYGDTVAIPAGVMIAVAWCGVIAAQLVAGARLLEGIIDIDFQWALAVVAIVFTVYTFWGGQLSVIRTDFWQLLLFIGGLFVALTFLILSQYSNPASWNNVPPAYWQFPVSSAFGWYEVLVFYPLIVGLPYLVGPDIYSRILCAADDGVARRAALLAATIVIPISFLLAFFGILAKAQFTGIAAESALPHTLGVLIPIGIKGLIAAGFLGAIMSSADTCLISASTILTLNVIQPAYRGDEKRNLLITRATVLLLGAVAWVIASQLKGIISSLILGYTVFVGGVVIPTLGSFFQKPLKITSTGALWAVIIGGSAAILGKINGGAIMKLALTSHGQAIMETVLGPQYLSIMPIILSALILLGVSRMR